MESGPRQREAGAAAESVPYRLLFEKNPLPMFVIDLETLRFLDVNEAAVSTYGYSRKEFLAMTIEDLRPPEDAPRVREALRSLRPRDRLVGFWRHRKKDGTIFQVEVLSTEVQARGRRARLVLVQDATERLRTDRHRATEIAVTRDLIEAKSFRDAAPRLIASICESEEWTLGEVWEYHAADSVLRLIARHPPLRRDAGREPVDGPLPVRAGEGLVGKMWQRDAPLWIRDLDAEFEGESLEGGARPGLESAAALPIRTKSGTGGVLVLFSKTKREADEAVLDLFADLGRRIGKVLERESVEASRRETTEAFDRAFQACPVPMGISFLRDGRFVEVNREFLREFGYDRSEVVGRTSMDLGMWVDAEERRILVDRLRERGAIRDAEVRVRTKAGEARRALMSVEYLDGREQPTIITTLVDITGVAEAHEDQRRLGALVESSDDAIFSKDLDGTIQSWNAGAERIYGYTAAEAIGQNVSILVPPERMDELTRILERLRKGERIDLFETVRLRKDGRKIVVSIRISPIRDDRDRLLGASTIARDITERKRAEQLLRRSEARFRQLFEVAADAILLIDRRGTILDVNPSGASLLGARDPAALRGINLGEVLPTHELEKARTYLRDLLHGRPTAEPFETYVEQKEGERRFVQVRSRVIREAGMDPYVQVIARDVTGDKEHHRRTLEDERRASMIQVASFIAHEVNTPLTNIALLSANAARGVTDPKLLEKLAKIDSQRRFATSILAEMQALTRSQEVKRIPVDVRGVVEAAIDLTVPLRKEAVKFVRELPPMPLVAEVDPLRMQRALASLLKNAFQATESGSVTMRLSADEGRLTIAVTDTGPGMDSEIRSRLFQPFYTTKPREEGLGLGLVLAKHVVEAHEGSIHVASEPGHGSTFTISLPYEPAGPSAPAPGSQSAAAPKAP